MDRHARRRRKSSHLPRVAPASAADRHARRARRLNCPVMPLQNMLSIIAMASPGVSTAAGFHRAADCATSAIAATVLPRRGTATSACVALNSGCTPTRLCLSSVWLGGYVRPTFSRGRLDTVMLVTTGDPRLVTACVLCTVPAFSDARFLPAKVVRNQRNRNDVIVLVSS